MPRRVKDALNAWRYAQYPDRRYLVDVIFPEIARRGVQKILWVGCEAVTVPYPRCFPGSEFLTLDYSEDKARFSSADRHTVGSVLDVERLFGPSRFDVVMMNGVFGWGLDRREDQEVALRAIHAVLKPEGLLLLGWNTDRSCEPTELEAGALYQPTALGAVPERKTFEGSTHVYNLWRKA